MFRRIRVCIFVDFWGCASTSLLGPAFFWPRACETVLNEGKLLGLGGDNPYQNFSELWWNGGIFFKNLRTKLEQCLEQIFEQIFEQSFEKSDKVLNKVLKKVIKFWKNFWVKLWTKFWVKLWTKFRTKF